MPSYVKFETPKDLVPQILEMLSVAKDSGKIKKGVNETTKAIERKTAQFVIMAEDVTPEEIIVHIPMLCDEKSIPYAYVPAKKDLGGAVGIPVGTSSVAVENAGGASEALNTLLKKIPRTSGTGATAARKEVPHAKPAEHAKPAHKEEHKAAEHKKEVPKEHAKPARKEEHKEAHKEHAKPAHKEEHKK